MALATVPAMITWSSSRLQLWDLCPARWFAKYVLQEPDPTSPPAAFGLAVHEALERIVPIVATRQFGPVRDRAASHWSPPLLGLINRIVTDQLIAHKPLTDPVGDMPAAINAVENALKGLSLAPRLEVEHVLVGRLTEVDRVQGRLDLTMVYPDHLVVRDWKTGRIPYPIGSSAQLSIYGLLAARTWGKPITVELQWLRHSSDVDAMVVTEDTMRGAKDWLLDRVATVRAALAAYEMSDSADQSAFVARPGSHCAYCPVAARCPVSALPEPACLENTPTTLNPTLELSNSVPPEILDKAAKILVLERQATDLKSELRAWYAEHHQPIPVGDGAFKEISSQKLVVEDVTELLTSLSTAGYGPEDVMTINKASFEKWQKRALKAGLNDLVASLAHIVHLEDGAKTFKFVKGGDGNA